MSHSILECTTNNKKSNPTLNFLYNLIIMNDLELKP